MRRGMWCSWAAAAVVAWMAAVMLAAPAQGSFPGKNGKLAVESQGENDYDIHVLNPDGTGRVNLTHTPGPSFERAPAWSPDGTRIAFTRGVQPISDQEVWVMNADGSGQVNLTDSPETEDFDAAWSPDGTRIAFASCCLDGLQIHVMNADGSGRAQLTHGETGEMFGPAWSPDGTRIAFYGADPQGGAIYQLFVMNADGSDVTQITTDPGASYMPDWSPDGSKLAFTKAIVEPEGGFVCCEQVYVADADGTNQIKLTGPDDPGFEDPVNAGPVWAPDGTRIAFTSLNREVFGRFDVWTIHPDGTSELRVTTSGGDGLGDWQPIPGPVRSDYRNASQYCRALRDFLGEADFGSRYRNHGTCVSSNL